MVYYDGKHYGNKEFGDLCLAQGFTTKGCMAYVRDETVRRPRVIIRGKYMSIAQYVLMKVSGGEVPPKKYATALHCGNPTCCSPLHLTWEDSATLVGVASRAGANPHYNPDTASFDYLEPRPIPGAMPGLVTTMRRLSIRMEAQWKQRPVWTLARAGFDDEHWQMSKPGQAEGVEPWLTLHNDGSVREPTE